MQMLISKPENWALDSTIFGIVVAGIAEGRIGDLAVARKHSNAAIALLNLRGGLRAIQDMQFPTGMIILYAYVTLGGTQLFSNSTRLGTASDTLKCRLQIFQKWNREIRTNCSTGSRKPTATAPTCENSMRKDPCIPGSLWYFGTSSVLRPYVESSFVDRASSQIRPYLAVLYAINSMLWALQDNEEAAIEFMDRVVHQIELSHPSSKDTNTSTTTSIAGLTVMALLFVLASEATNLGHWKSSEDAAFRSWEIIEFVELVMLASHQSRKRIVASMASWLITDLHNPDGLLLIEDSDFDAMEDEVEIRYFTDNRWLRDNTT
ncbi:hypothetical protein LTR84_002560 [Exophiala bonariae]|uniref:Transcription factor domain-containing protein n=1 Tax=Exophiala bonariae TaxID=1690606 RepID=A0AAV9NDT8_9EURO|nr:hypothetical protein LTR84_002560 [Exophiala bonariae]